jgi:hypothetical protein
MYEVPVAESTRTKPPRSSGEDSRKLAQLATKRRVNLTRVNSSHAAPAAERSETTILPPPSPTRTVSSVIVALAVRLVFHLPGTVIRPPAPVGMRSVTKAGVERLVMSKIAQ